MWGGGRHHDLCMKAVSWLLKAASWLQRVALRFLRALSWFLTSGCSIPTGHEHDALEGRDVYLRGAALWLESIGGECRMVGVAGATPNLPLPYQLFVGLSLLAIPKHAKSPLNHALAIPTLDTMLHPCLRVATSGVFRNWKMGGQNVSRGCQRFLGHQAQTIPIYYG